MLARLQDIDFFIAINSPKVIIQTVGHRTLLKSKRPKMALIRSPEFQGVNVQIVCIAKIQFESA